MAGPLTIVRGAHRRPGRRRDRGRAWRAALLLVFVVGLTAWNGWESAEHVLTDRDPGVYVTTARWLAEEGSLRVEPAIGPFAGQPELTFEAPGWHRDGAGHLEPQFLHLLAGILAVAHLAGGDEALLLAPAVLGGLALLAFHGFARRVVRGWWALAATVVLGVDLVWVRLSRDAFSEVPAMLLLFAGLTLLWEAERRDRPSLALVAGLLLGGVATARVEGFVLLLGLVAAVAGGLVVAQAGSFAERRRAFRRMVALLVGVVLAVAVAVVDLTLFSSWYFRQLRGLLVAVAAGLGVAGALAVAAVALAGRRRRLRGRRRPDRPPLRRTADLAAVLVVAAGAVAWFVRPRLAPVTGPFSTAIADLQQGQGLVPDGTSRYSEHSVEWLAWYLGPLVVAAGLLGAALVVRRLVRARGQDLRLLPFLSTFAVISALYLWRPSITPDHIWVMRRYALVTIPGLVLLAALAGQHVADWAAARTRAWVAPVAGGAAVVAAAAFPVATLVPVASATTQDGMLAGVERVCDAVGDDGAVVVADGGQLELLVPQTLRSFCGVPVAVAGPRVRAATLHALADAWVAEGRTLHLLGAAPDTVTRLAGGPVELAVTVPNDEELEATVTRRPASVVSVPVTFVVAEVAGAADLARGAAVTEVADAGTRP